MLSGSLIDAAWKARSREHTASFSSHGDCDDSAASWHLEDIVAMVGHRHELGQGRIPKDGIIWQENAGDIEVDELGTVIVALPGSDRAADLPYPGSGAVSDS